MTTPRGEPNDYDAPTTINQACTHPRATHHHGTRACYASDGCRCDPCKKAQQRYIRAQRNSCVDCGQPAHSRGLCNRCYHRLKRQGAFTPQPQPLQEDSWRTRAACHNTHNPAFFPTTGQTRSAHDAIAICDTCPVRAECLQYALTLKPKAEGIWGGTTERQRRGMRRARRTEVA